MTSISRAEYRLYGAQLLNLKPWGVFYVSPQVVSGTQVVRGGQPLLFPQFADRGGLRKHGFVRDVRWELVAEELAPLRHRIILAKSIRKDEFCGWPYEAKLELDIECVPGRVQQIFKINNTGSELFSWTGGMHPYFSLTDICAASIEGLRGVGYSDRYKSGLQHQTANALKWNEEPCEKLFNAASELVLWTGARSIRLKTSGFDQWMVWNPGRDGAKKMADLPDADWNKFVCIEPVCVDRPVTLAPGETFRGAFEIVFEVANEKLSV